MKTPHNYITPLPPKKEQELFQWYTYSAYASFVCIIALLSINGYQYYQVRSVNSARADKQAMLVELQKSVEQHETLKRKQAQLQEQIATLENLNKQQHSPSKIMQSIEKAIPADACLTELRYHDTGELALHGYAQTAETALLFLTTLQETDALKKLELASLAPVKFQEQDKTWYQFDMKMKKAQQSAPYFQNREI